MSSTEKSVREKLQAVTDPTKDVREKFGIGADDRLAVVSWERGGRPCCLTLLRADELADAVRRTYGPVLGDAVRG